MNSYTLTDKLRKARRRYCISAGAQALYYELIAINNEEGWSEETFKCTATELCGALGVSEKTLSCYRDELMIAQLLGYRSGKTKRVPSTYCLFGSCFGSMIGSNIYHLNEHQTEHPSVSKTPDLIKTKRETKTKIKEVVVVEARSRQNEFNEEADKYFSEIDKNSNSAFPESAYLPDEKEKNSAQKEKEYPDLKTAREKLVLTASWRNILEHHKVTEDEREELFKLFYEQKEDAYRIRYPTANDMASHFYYWISARQRLQILKPALGISNDNTITKTTNFRKRTEDTRAELTNLNQRSSDFLRSTAG